MILTWSRKDAFLVAGDRRVECWSKVRNELNGLRPYVPLHEDKTDVVRSFPANVPIMPRPFPVGNWQITGFRIHPNVATDGYLYPVFIATDAINECPEWELDSNGRYLRPTGRVVHDGANGLHFSTSDWTQGCLRVAKESDIRWLWLSLTPGVDRIIVRD
jgi:hypothetical protein